MRCHGNSLISVLELRCIFSFNKWSFCSGGGSEGRLGDGAGQPLAASRGAPASSEIVAGYFSHARDRVSREKTARRGARELLRKQQADDALKLPQKQKAKPRQPDAPPPEAKKRGLWPSLEAPDGERPSKKAKLESCAKTAASGAASSSQTGSQEV